MGTRDEILSKIKNVVTGKSPGAEILLYGSHARGDAKPHSDWDVLILLDLPNLTFDFETKLINEFYEIELETGEIISPLIYTKKDWEERHFITPFYENVQKEGVRI